MDEPAGGGAAGGAVAPSQAATRARQANNRIKLNRDLMQRLVSALGNQAASCSKRQHLQQQPQSAAIGEPKKPLAASSRLRQLEQVREATTKATRASSNNKSSPTWAPINQQWQLEIGKPTTPSSQSLSETCFASSWNALTTTTSRLGQQQARRQQPPRPPVYTDSHGASSSSSSSNCSRGKQCCCCRCSRARRKRCRVAVGARAPPSGASSFCHYANDNSARVCPLASNSARQANNRNSSRNSIRSSHSTGPNNAPDKQSDSDANNRSRALFLVAPLPSGHCLGRLRQTRLRHQRRLRRPPLTLAGGLRAPQVAGPLPRRRPLGSRRPPSGHNERCRRRREAAASDRIYDHHQRPGRKASEQAQQSESCAATCRQIKPTTVIAAKTTSRELAAGTNSSSKLSTKSNSNSPLANATSWQESCQAAEWKTRAREAQTQNNISNKDSSSSSSSSRSRSRSQCQELKRPAAAATSRLQDDASAEQITQQQQQQQRRRRRASQMSAGREQPPAQFMTCDTRPPAPRKTRATSKLVAANQQLAARARAKLRRVPVTSPAASKRAPISLNWLLLVLLGPVLLLALLSLLQPAPIRPASCLELPAASSLAPPAANGTTGSSAEAAASGRPSTSRSDTDEFSRAVMATMSTQSSLGDSSASLASREKSAGSSGSTASLTTGREEPEAEPLPSAQPLGSQSSDDDDSPAARTPPTLNELDSSDDVILADERPLVRAAASAEPAAHESTSSSLAASSRAPMTQLHAELQQQQQANQKNGSSASGAGQPAQKPGELEDYFNKFVDFARIFAMVAIMIGDICGNSLVILSVVRHSKLRVTTNWFVVSLACADILVALFAMTFNASVQITGMWIFPRWMCDFWNSCDVLASTASILHLCCISIDRYYAIMRPLDYPMKITTRRVCYALAVVWISSALLSYIPIFTGIYTTSEHMIWQQANPDQCEFVVNRVYAIVSSSISFWIPCCIMVFTYYKIYQEATRQEKFIYKAQSMMPAPQANHHRSSNAAPNRTKQHRSKSMAITSLSSSSSSAANSANAKGRAKANAAHQIKQFAAKQEAEAAAASSSDALNVTTVTETGASPANANSEKAPAAAAQAAEQQPLIGSAVDLNNNGAANLAANKKQVAVGKAQEAPQVAADDQDDRDSNSGQSTPTKRSISKMKREHKAAKTLGIIMGVFILCWLPFFSWYTPQHICGHACDGIIPHNVVTLLFWIGYFNSTLNPIIYAYFNHEFRDAFKKTLQWLFCCCRDLKCLRVNRPNDNQHYNCTYRSTQEIGLVSNG